MGTVLTGNDLDMKKRTSDKKIQLNKKRIKAGIAVLSVAAVAVGGIFTYIQPAEVYAKESLGGMEQIVQAHDEEDPFTILDIVPGNGTYTFVYPDDVDPNVEHNLTCNFSLGTIGYLAGDQAPVTQDLMKIYTENSNIFYSYANRKKLAEEVIATGYEDGFLHLEYMESYAGMEQNLTAENGWTKVYDPLSADEMAAGANVPTGRIKAYVSDWETGTETDRTGFDYNWIDPGSGTSLSGYSLRNTGTYTGDEEFFLVDEEGDQGEYGEYQVEFGNPEMNIQGYRATVISTDWTNYPDATFVYEKIVNDDNEEFRYVGTVRELKAQLYGEDDTDADVPEDDNLEPEEGGSAEPEEGSSTEPVGDEDTEPEEDDDADSGENDNTDPVGNEEGSEAENDTPVQGEGEGNSESTGENSTMSGSSAALGWRKLVETGVSRSEEYYILEFEYVYEPEEAEQLYQVINFRPVAVGEGEARPCYTYNRENALIWLNGEVSLFTGEGGVGGGGAATEPTLEGSFVYVGPGQGRYKLTAAHSVQSAASGGWSTYVSPNPLVDDHEHYIEVRNAPVYIRCSNNDWLLRYVFHSLKKQDNADEDFSIKVQTVTAAEVTYEAVQDADLVYLEDGVNSFLSTQVSPVYIGTNPGGIEDIDEGVIATLLYEAVTYQKPVMVDYSIIEDTAKYMDSDYRKLAKVFLKKDLQSFYFAMNQGENLAENVLMNVDSDDYPNKKDNDYNYVNRNIYIVNAATKLVAEDFPEAVDEDEAKAGFKEVLAAIKAENSTLSEDDEIAEEVSKAMAVQYIINYAVGMIGEYKDLSILELQPTANVKSDLHSSLDSENHSVVLYWQREDREEPGQQILRSNKEIETKITVKSVSEFNGRYEDVNSTYDMIFIGLDGQNLNLKTGRNPETVYNDSDLNGKVYHSGDKVAGSDFRYDANDITDGKKEVLLDYMRAGYPIVVEDACFKDRTAKDAGSKDINTDYIGSDTQMYEFLKTAISEYEDYIYTISDVHSSALFTVQLNTMRPRIEWLHDAEASRVVETELTESKYYRGSIEYRITNDRKPEEHRYAGDIVKHVYLDLNYDGVFTKEEEISEYGEGTSEKGSVISVDFRDVSFGIVPWKVEIADAGNEWRRDAIQGYFRITGEEETPVRVLQVLDDPSKETANLQFLYGEATNSSLGYFLKGAEGLLHAKFEIETVTPAVLSDRLANNVLYLKSWDVLVLGFGESGNPGDTVVSAVNSFISEGGSVVVSSAGAEEESGRLGLTAGYLGQTDQMTYGRLGRDSGSYYRYSGLDGGMFYKKQGLYAENINDGCITIYPYQIDSRVAFGTATSLKAPDYLLNTGISLDDNEIRTTAWYTLNESGEGRNAYNVSPGDAGNNYYVYSKGNVVYVGQSEYPYIYDAENHKIPEGDGTAECRLFVNALMAAYQGGIHPSEVSIVAGFPATSSEIESIAIPFDQELKTEGDADGGILDETVDVYFKFVDNNLALDKTMQVSFYYENDAGEQLALPQQTVMATAFGSPLETVEENQLITVDGSALKQGQVYRIKAPVSALRDSDKSNVAIYIVLTSEFNKAGRHVQVMSADSVSLNRAQMFLLE